MTSLSDRLDQYTAERRSHGGNWASQAKQVRPFVTFADSRAEWITTGLFLRWKERFGDRMGRQAVGGARLRRVAAGARPADGSASQGADTPSGVRPKPYIYSDREIRRIVAEAARLECHTGLRGTFSTVRIDCRHRYAHREALALHDADVDPDSAIIRVRHAKNGRDRIPVTSCTAERLRMHRNTRNRILGRATQAFFCGTGGDRLSADTPRYNFAKISQRIGLREPQTGTKGRGPRLHDLRHTFATRTSSTGSGRARMSTPVRSAPSLDMTAPTAPGGHRVRPRTPGSRARPGRFVARQGRTDMTPHPLSAQVQTFFTARLANQLGASPNTVASYRDTFRLLLVFASTDLRVEVDAKLVGRFLGPRRRSTQQRPHPQCPADAIRSFFSHVSRCEPALLDRPTGARPSKRFEQRMVDYLTGALLAAPTSRPGRGGATGRCSCMVQAGIRVSELTMRRPRVGNRGPCPRQRQGPQGAVNAAQGRCRHGAPGMAEGARGR